MRVFAPRYVFSERVTYVVPCVIQKSSVVVDYGRVFTKLVIWTFCQIYPVSGVRGSVDYTDLWLVFVGKRRRSFGEFWILHYRFYRETYAFWKRAIEQGLRVTRLLPQPQGFLWIKVLLQGCSYRGATEVVANKFF